MGKNSYGFNETNLSQARLDNSQRIGGLGDWEYDFVNQRLLWSEEVYRILGLSRKDNPPNSATFYSRVHPDDIAYVHQKKKTAAEGLSRVDFEHRIIRPDGEVRHIHQIAEMVFDAQGQPIRESGTIQDITERKLTEETLRQSENRFRTLSESTPLGVFECDAAGRVIYYNPAMAALSGRPAESSNGQGWEENIHPDDRAAVSAGWAHAIAEGLTWDQEQRLLQPDGSVRWVHTLTAPRKGADGRITGFVGTVEDISERHVANVALFESEERFRKLIMSSPDAHYVHVDGLITLVNPAFCQMVGATRPEQLLGKQALEMIHPDFHHLAHERRRKHHADQPIPADEMRIVRLDGTTVDVEIAGVAFDIHGRKEVHAIARDITGRKKAEESLRLLGSAVEQSRESIVITEAELDWPGPKIVFVNPAFTMMTGYAAQEVIGKTPRILQGPRTDKAVLNRLRQNLQQGESFAGEAINYRKDGTEYIQEWQIAPLRNATGKITHFVSVQRDITIRRAAETALRESEERFRFVARAISDALWDWDISANTVWWNEGYFSAFGFAANEIPSSFKSWESRIHPDERSRVIESIHQAVDSGVESWRSEYRIQRKDGSYAFVQDNGYILRNAAGKGIRMVGGLRDLTEQKEVEAQSLRTQRMESIGTLAGGISHDLNNVLAPIMMSIELLKLDSSSDPNHGRILETIEACCRRGADLVCQVLCFAKGVDGQRIPIRLRHIINDLYGIISETFPRNIEIVTNVPNELWPIMGDPTQLHQVLLNLAVNARDAMPDGGKLTMASSNITLDAQYAGMSEEAKAGPYVLLRVIDTGVGIPPEIRERIFEPFFTTKVPGKGTGLGLATVHTVVKSHGGFLSIESDAGRGTTFNIYLPADPALQTTATLHPFRVALPRGKDELVLVIDDESSIRDITRRTLETFGYRVITATDGVEAVALYAKQAQQIAVVLTDMMMPVMDGATTIQVLTRLNPSVRIIAVSGIDSGENLTKATKAGVHEFLLKPYTAETLLKRIRKVLDRCTVATKATVEPERG